MEIYVANIAWAAQMLRDLLEAEGIRAHVREALHPYPLRKSEYTVYIENPDDEARAREIAGTFDEHASAAPGDPGARWPWRCRNCGEDVEPQFTACWRCQTPRPPAT